ncbi:MAG: MFS transporter [Chloroflexi bacterium]|nr:MFS transporter [Chloroflexota bacterium]MDK1046066.1 MFS transporter [Anaerolineales bacterium]MCH8341783.1 MFS transporter [Chloroflexota bacterium]MCH8877925.1 MFS transporter [Chloroflexota bacterium]MCI0772503.1 MFS transporter [Chloroflexota bacterium]
MWITRQKNRLQDLYREFPRPFWTLTGVTLIDQVGGALLYPFFALYFTSRFEVGMTQVGFLFALYAVSSFAGQLIGGALSDRIGRRTLLIFSLVTTSTSSLLMGIVESVTLFYALAIFVGVFVESGQPARQAIVADLLPEDKRAEGYAIIRVAFNLATAIGPAIGGFVASRSYLALFVADAVISLIAAFIVWRLMPETKPELVEGEADESFASSFGGYGKVLRDRLFVLFLLAGMLVGLVGMNLFTTLGVYLRDNFDVPTQGYGLLLAMNALLVVVFQIPVGRRAERYPPMIVMGIGSALYGIGFGMFAFVSTVALFAAAMLVLTVGEMMIVPVSQAVVARFAPEAMRGRYMAIYGMSWSLPIAVGPLMAGLVMDNADPRLLYWGSGLLGLLATAAYLGLHSQMREEPVANLAEASD